MTKREVTEKLTGAAVNLYIQYLDQREGDYTPETNEQFYRDMLTEQGTIAYAARALGVKIPTVDKVYMLARIERAKARAV